MHKAASPEALGVSSEGILRCLDALRRERMTLHTLLIVRHGRIASALEWSPCRTDEPHMICALGQMLISIAVAFAVQEGLLRYSDPVLLYLGDLAPAKPPARLARVTLHHLLSMTSGLSPKAEELIIGRTPDVLQKTLAAPLVDEPGAAFRYHTLGFHLLCEVLRRVTGQNPTEYLTPRLFAPLGIRTPYCGASPLGSEYAAWGCRMSAEDLALVGQLLLQDGVWNGRRVLPDFFVRTAATKQADTADRNPESEWEQGFGYGFWRDREGSYRCCGIGGQMLVMLPRQDAVIVTTGCCDDLFRLYALLREHLFPALLPGDDLPPTTHSDRLARRAVRLTLRPPYSDDGSVTIRPGLYRAENGCELCVEWRPPLLCLRFWDSPRALPYCFLYGRRPFSSSYSPYFPDDLPLTYRACWGARDGRLICDVELPQAPFHRHDEIVFSSDSLTDTSVGFGLPEEISVYARVG